MSKPSTGRELRHQNLSQLDGGSFDVLVIGAGINGAVSAAALAARGLKVALVDRGDVASMTSQESSNLVWGGFKYLQTYELGLVWKLCGSRNQLMESYPTAIKEIGFLATLDKSSPFPAWLAGLGSVGYWGIGRFATTRPRWFSRAKLKETEPVVNTDTASAGLEYADAYLPDNDARFVWSFVRKAMELGAAAANYVEVTDLFRVDDRWQVDLVDRLEGDHTGSSEKRTLDAAVVVNAAGPLVDPLNETAKVQTDHRIVYSKGIHLVVPKITDSDRVLAFFDDTQRLFYVIPMAHRSVIGTTDTRTTELGEAVTDEERRFVLEQINARLDLDQPLTVDDIVGERSGVRPLVVETGDNSHNEIDWTKLSRKHVVEADTDRAMVSILGGKLTDCLNVGDEVVEAVGEVLASLPSTPGSAVPRLSSPRPWFGEPPPEQRQRFEQRAATLGLDRRPTVERAASVAEVLWRRHGSAAHQILDAIEADPDLGNEALANSDILRGELPVIAENEMIISLSDFLRRRTKLSLIARDEELAADPGMAEVRQVLGLSG